MAATESSDKEKMYDLSDGNIITVGNEQDHEGRLNRTFREGENKMGANKMSKMSNMNKINKRPMEAYGEGTTLTHGNRPWGWTECSNVGCCTTFSAEADAR